MMVEALFFLVAISYAVLILSLTAGWFKLPVFWPFGASSVSFSIIVPFKNEEKSIISLLESLRNLKYPADKFEVLLIDDHSTDTGPEKIKQRLNSGMYNNFRLIRAAEVNEKTGKKNAISLGILHAKFNWVVTTDADCIIGRHWLESFSSFIEKENPDMIIGLVAVVAGKRLFMQMQALEFMSLSGVTTGSAAMGHPIMCNGANLAYKKELFEKAGGYEGNQQYISGDDMFLLQNFKKNAALKIRPIKSHGAAVFTRPESSLKNLLKQRARWAGKAGGYTDRFTLISGAIVAITNLIIAAGLALGFAFAERLLLPSLVLLAFKMVVDFPLLFAVSGFLRKRDLLWLYPALAVIYPFYVLTSIFAGFLCKQNWK